MISPFVLLFTLTFSACNITIQEDVIFLLDYSSSVHTTEFEDQKQFAAKMVRNYLPNNTRVACVGFGTYPTVFFGLDEFEDQNFDREMIAQGIETRAFHVGGRTYLQRALEAVTANVIDPHSPRRKLLVLITDGAPSDYPCLFAPDLERAGVKTIVIGITMAFFPAFVECLVQSTEDIMQVDNFDQFAALEVQLGDYICSADYHIEVTEINAGGTDRFIEFVNKGTIIQTADLVLYSNLLVNSPYRFPQSFLPTGHRLMLSESSIADCAGNCQRFATDFVSNSSWSILLRQEFVREDQKFEHDIISISFDYLSEPKPTVSDGYSLEKIEGFNMNLGSSWRRSCTRGGSPGVANNVTCHVPCDLQSDDCGASNTCTADGCECANIGFLEQSSACPEIPAPRSCVISGFVQDVEDCQPTRAQISWEPSEASWIVGYRLTWGSSFDTNIWEGLYETTLLWDHCDWDSFAVSAIAEFVSYENGNRTEYTPLRWSLQTNCEVNMSTPLPTVSPTTTIPSVRPSQSPTNVPSAKPSVSPSAKPSAYPSSCPSVAPSMLPTLPPMSGSPTVSPSIFPSHSPSFTPSHDPTTTRPSYLPSLQPQWDHPEVTVGGLNWYKVRGIYFFNSTKMLSNQHIKVDVRIFQSPDYVSVTIYWALYERVSLNRTSERRALHSTLRLVRRDQYTFPEAATLTQTDLVEIDAGLVEMGNQDETTLEFHVLQTNETDRFGRLKYRIGYPSISVIHVEKAEASTVVVTTENESEIPLWMLGAIGLASLCICCFACCCVFRQRKLRKKAEHDMKEVEEDLRREQDGFFHDLPEHQVHDNPMASSFSMIGMSPVLVKKKSSIAIMHTEEVELVKMQAAEIEQESVRRSSGLKIPQITPGKSGSFDDISREPSEPRTTQSRSTWSSLKSKSRSIHSSVKPMRHIQRRRKSDTTDYRFDMRHIPANHEQPAIPVPSGRRNSDTTDYLFDMRFIRTDSEICAVPVPKTTWQNKPFSMQKKRNSVHVFTHLELRSARKPVQVTRRKSSHDALSAIDKRLIQRHSPADSDLYRRPLPMSTQRPPLDCAYDEIGGSSLEDNLDNLLSVNPASFASTVYQLHRMSVDREAGMSVAGTQYEEYFDEDFTDDSVPPIPQRSMSETDKFLAENRIMFSL